MRVKFSGIMVAWLAYAVMVVAWAVTMAGVWSPRHGLEPRVMTIPPLPSLKAQGPKALPPQALPPQALPSAAGKKVQSQYERIAQVPSKPVVGAKVAIVVLGLGPNKALTQRFIQELPGDITLGFSPYARNVGALMAQARAFAHETLMMIPMEPIAYPRLDPGPLALLVGAPIYKNQQRLKDVLSRGGQEYVGVTEFMGSRFVGSAPDLQPVLEAIQKYGVLYFEGTQRPQSVVEKLADAADLPYLKTTVAIDFNTLQTPLPEVLKEMLKKLTVEDTLILKLPAAPAVLESLKTLLKEANPKNITFVPLTATLPKELRPGA